ncbi:MAG TPA: CHAT domain-containing protein, partial [Blastocatellia bacterium]|nr:CHAT domain-containing protein [Blastocatellia bacterium]
FREDNDLIVNTRSMTGGMKREKGAFKFFDHGQEVSHFNYFTNHKTRTRLVNWLKSEQADAIAAEKAGFESLTPEAERAMVSRGSLAAKPETLPVVFVVPGIMGSHLSVDDDRIWLDPFSLALGGMNKLRINAERVVPEAVVASAYKDLIRFLKDRYEVIPFPYDWRLSLEKAAANLAEAVERELKNHKRPIRFVAHSMGGLVVRTMIAKHDDTWQQLKSRDSRVLMLGTPNRGSYVVPQILAGKEKTLSLLATVDLKNDKAKLIEIIRQYNGLLEMLPEDFFENAAWKNIPPPDADDLAAAKTLRASLATAVDKDRMIYVAGTSASTPFKLEAAGNGVNFIGTTEGDGRVTYEMGKLDGVKTWFANAEHGDLAAHRDSFNAFVDLLERGTTDKLPTSPIVRRGATEEAKEHLIVEEEIQMFPDETDLAAAALGGQIAAAEDLEVHTLNISIVHTHLRNAKYPIAVGHYKGDQIVGAEGVINRLLDNRLSQLSQLGLYPGDEGTAEILRLKDAEIEGVMVIGLGDFGDIKREKVRNGIITASLRYALSLLNDDDKKKSGRPVNASFSALLLGTYSSSSFNAMDSVSAIVEGAIQTNRLLQKQGLWNQVRINTVELIELYEDIATQAVRAAQRLTERPPLDLSPGEKLALDPPYLVCREGGQPQRPLDLYSSGWSRKIRIAVDDKPTDNNSEDKAADAKADAAENKEKRLNFTVYTERARIEEKMLPTQRKLINGLIKQAIDSGDYSNRLGATLFELLIPNSFKDQISAEGDLVLYVDSESAQYPWELLAERTREDVTPVVMGKGGSGRGMIRQLATGDFRPNPQAARGGNVLIVGDPVLTGETEFAPLPGARQEAMIVNQAFGTARGGQFSTYPLLGSNALSIVTNLFERDYRIIHLAGHGMYDAKHPLQSGMILGNGMRLTAAEIQQLRIVPDLVFINCCYLGLVDAKPEANKLAASISMELIKMGVRAVVAAGWEVNDDAAKTFAEVFYQCMLENMRFGDAVKTARSRTYRDHPQTNTWGAYQCYGDPDFILDRPSGSKSADKKSERYFSPREYRDELRRAAEQAKQADSSYRKILRSRLEAIYDSMPTAWMDAEMLGILGDAWGSLDEFEESRKFYDNACKNEVSTITLKQIQQHANLLSLYAKQLHQAKPGRKTKAAADAPAPAQPADLLDESLELLKKLEQLNPTSELASLFGIHYQRRAQVLGNVEANLKQAAKHFKEATQKADLKKGRLNPAPALNWIVVETLLATLATARTKDTKRMQESLAEIGNYLNEVLEVAADLKSNDATQERLHLPNATLLRLLLDGELGIDEKVKDLLKSYRKALRGKSDLKSLNAVTGQLDFMIEMLERGRGTHDAEINALREIKTAIEEER